MQRSLVLLFLLTGLAPASRAAGKNISITVDAGDFERRNTVVTFTLPSNARAFDQIQDAQEKVSPLQIEKDGHASFVVTQLGKGAKASYRLMNSKPGVTPADVVEVTREKTKLNIRVSGHPLLSYEAGPGALPRDDIKPLFLRGGYIHPIQTLGGTLVSDDYPPNHIHHHGVWWAWTKTEFEGRHPDFWNMGDGKGRVEFVALDEYRGGPVHGGFIARHRFVDLTAPAPVTALKETWVVRVYNNATAPFWMFDLISTQECAASEALKLPRYHYGGLGFRGHRAWDGKDGVDFLTSAGETDRVKGNTKRGRWCDISGSVDGATAGIAIFCHPENFRAPQPMRLHPTEPFFCFAPQQEGDMEIAPGRRYVSRFRFVVHDGAPDKAVLERLWNDYAHPPAVKIE